MSKLLFLQRTEVRALPAQLPMLPIKYLRLLPLRLHLRRSLPELPPMPNCRRPSEYRLPGVLLPSAGTRVRLFLLPNWTLRFPDRRPVHQPSGLSRNNKPGRMHFLRCSLFPQPGSLHFVRCLLRRLQRSVALSGLREWVFQCFERGLLALPGLFAGMHCLHFLQRLHLLRRCLQAQRGQLQCVLEQLRGLLANCLHQLQQPERAHRWAVLSLQ